jgi:hypothetical protein
MAVPNGKPAAAGSPDSVPSLAETSYASSQQQQPEYEEDDDDDDLVARALFINDEGEEVSLRNNIVENIFKLSQDRDESREVYGSGSISITSSETTVIPTWNLSPPKNIYDEGSFPTAKKVVPTPTPPKEDESSSKAAAASPLVFEEPPKESLSCNGALSLTPRQLAEIFMAFEARHIWPAKTAPKEETAAKDQKETTAQVDAMITPTSPIRQDGWMPRAESLGKECAALKKIIQDDSFKLLNLKRAMEAQHELNSLKEMEIEDKQIELQIAEDRLEALKREKEESRERESELVETIRILKTEVDKLTRYKAMVECQPPSSEASLHDEAEYQDLSADLQLFSSQTVEQELTIVELRTTIDKKEKENQRLRTDIEDLQKRLEEQSKAGANSNLADDEEAIRKGTPTELGEFLQNISKRLEAVEKEKEQTESLFLQELRKKNDEMDEFRLLLKRESQRSEAVLKISQDPDEIEVLLHGKQKEDKAQIPNSGCCCHAWSALSYDD